MRRVCVFCGASPGRDPVHAEAARALGRILAHQQLTLVYGGGHVGLMGVVADSVLAHGGQAIGVIPEFLQARELAHPRLTELYVVPSMHERKAKMAELSDAFIALPGGYGTFEELFEVLTWGQLGLHQKPHGLLNVNGYYDRLIEFIQHALQEEFIADRYRSLLLTERDPDALLTLMRQWQPKTERWPRPAEGQIIREKL